MGSGSLGKFTSTIGKGISESTILGGISHYGYEKPRASAKQAEAETRQSAEQSAEQSATLSQQPAEEKRRRRMLLLNPSAQLQTSMATGRGKLLGV